MKSRYVIVGGGAGGLELACRLGRKLGAGNVLLVDRQLYHIWKPSLHEVAAGTLDVHAEGLSYQMLAHDNRFTFVHGAMDALDATARTISIAPVADDDGETVLRRRTINYERLVLAVGSTSNHFGVPGAEEHTISLNDIDDAERFRLKVLTRLARSASGHSAHGLDIVIIGGGATGVELAAELRQASEIYAAYGLGLEPMRDLRITILEGAPRVLAPLPERVSRSAARLLDARAVRIHTGTRVTHIGPDRVEVKGGGVFPADVVVWAAGIKAPDFLEALGLPVVRSGQIDVASNLAVKGFMHIYAIGDCAACVGAGGESVPPRAQAAHQQASYLYEAFLSSERWGRSRGRAFVYRDHGSIVSIGRETSVGSLMGALRGKSWFIEGFVARLMYTSLHLLHHRAILGTFRTAVLALARFLIKRSTPLVKLH